MAIDLPSSTEVAYKKFVTDMSSWRHRFDQIIAALSDANDNPADVLLIYYRRFAHLRSYLNDLILITDLNAVAQAIEEDPTYDCVAECTATINSLTSTIAWVDTQFPSSGGYILEKQISDGAITGRVFTPNQVQNVPTPADSLLSNVQAIRDTMSG